MSSVAQRLLTAEEFWQLPNSEHLELVRGEVRDIMPPGGRHGEVALALGTLLRIWSKQGAGGYVAVESGYVLGGNPDTLRAPDVSYVRAERVPPGGSPDTFWTIPPDLAVEVVSSSETANEVQAKVQDFLLAGTPLIWIVYPPIGTVIVYTADGSGRTYKGDDVLENQDVLPGFSCKVSDLFE